MKSIRIRCISAFLYTLLLSLLMGNQTVQAGSGDIVWAKSADRKNFDLGLDKDVNNLISAGGYDIFVDRLVSGKNASAVMLDPSRIAFQEITSGLRAEGN